MSACSMISDKATQADTAAHQVDQKMHTVDATIHAVVSPLPTQQKE